MPHDFAAKRDFSRTLEPMAQSEYHVWRPGRTASDLMSSKNKDDYAHWRGNCKNDIYSDAEARTQLRAPPLFSDAQTPAAGLGLKRTDDTFKLD